MLRTAYEVWLAVQEALFATRRNRIIVTVAAVSIFLATILMLLEISYRAQIAQEEPSPMFTGSLPASPFGPHKITFEPNNVPWTPLAPTINLFASPTQWEVALPSRVVLPPMPAQSDLIPLPSQPKRP